jgi:hypothetical protein
LEKLIETQGNKMIHIETLFRDKIKPDGKRWTKIFTQMIGMANKFKTWNLYPWLLKNLKVN